MNRTSKTYQVGNRKVWYDRYTRLWVCQTVDTNDFQVGDAQYDGVRKIAFRWLNTGSFIEKKP